MAKFLMPTHNTKLPVSFDRGEGVWLWDKKGRKYLDTFSGFGVSALGYSHPDIIHTIQTQAKKLIHVSDLYHIEEAEKLAKKLLTIAGMEKAIFVNSGSEANEVAIKLTRLHAKKRNILDPLVISFSKAYHGNTFAALSVSDVKKVQQGFEPLVTNFIHAPFNNLAALQGLIKANKNAVAIMLEPIQGDGGIRIPDAEYLKEIQKLCDEFSLLFIVDEVQSGIGRSGKWFAFQHEDCLPDVITTAKALANGIPIGACLTRGKASDLLRPGQHGPTFGSNPLACATALTTLNIIEKTDLLKQVQKRGNQLVSGLQEALHAHPGILEIRGKGLMVGIELKEPCQEIIKLGLNHGMLLNVVAEQVIRLLPAYIISADEINYLTENLSSCIREFLK